MIPIPQRVSDTSKAVTTLRAAQQGLTVLLRRDMRGLRRIIVPARLQQTVPPWITAANTLIGQYSQASASLAADYYESERVAAHVTGTFTVPLLDPPPDEQVQESLRWATKDLWPRDPEDPATTPAQLLPLDERLDAAETKAEAVAQKLVQDTGRGTVVGAVRSDKQAVAWARSAALGACAFCKLLASRGAVYKADTVTFRAHDACHCMALPVFRGQKFELSDQAQKWADLYSEHAAPFAGDQLNRFRQALAEHDPVPSLG